MAGRFEALESAVRLILEGEPVVLYDLFPGSSGGGGVTLLLDREGGIGLDDLAHYTRLVKFNPDIIALFPEGLALEVSSPGIHRPLRQPWHYQKALGRPVKVALKELHEGRRNFEGELAQADEKGFTLTHEDQTHHFAYSQVKTAKTNDQLFMGAKS